METGIILCYGGASAPANWLLCDGSAVSRTTYADLFAAIGTEFGAGDGTTTFNLPDFRGRTPQGAATQGTIAVQAGNETEVLAEADMGSHTHDAIAHDRSASTHLQDVYSSYYDTPSSTSGRSLTSTAAGSGTAHNNMAPFVVLNFIVKT